MQSKAKTVAAYLKELEPERRKSMQVVLKVLRAHMPKGFEEGMSYGMICWVVPHSIFPEGYHVNPKQALPFAAFASQKNHMSLYLMSAYAEGTSGEVWIKKAWPKDKKKLDIGKSCIRFKHEDDLALDVIGEAVRRISVKEHLAWYAAVDPRNTKKPAKKKATKAL